MTGFDEQRIEDYDPAIGTEMNYCHYWLAALQGDVYWCRATIESTSSKTAKTTPSHKLASPSWSHM